MKNKIGKNIIGNYRNYILLGICIILAVANVVMTIGRATAGVEIASLRETENKLSDQKRSLEDNLVRSLSINQLQDKSTELGFVKPADTLYLSESAPVAKLP